MDVMESCQSISSKLLTLQVVWGKGEIILDSVQLASDSRVVWPLGCKSNKGPPKGSNSLYLFDAKTCENHCHPLVVLEIAQKTEQKKAPDLRLNPDPKKLDWHWFPGWPF